MSDEHKHEWRFLAQEPGRGILLCEWCDFEMTDERASDYLNALETFASETATALNKLLEENAFSGETPAYKLHRMNEGILMIDRNPPRPSPLTGE